MRTETKVVSKPQTGPSRQTRPRARAGLRAHSTCRRSGCQPSNAETVRRPVQGPLRRLGTRVCGDCRTGGPTHGPPEAACPCLSTKAGSITSPHPTARPTRGRRLQVVFQGKTFQSVTRAITTGRWVLTPDGKIEFTTFNSAMSRLVEKRVNFPKSRANSRTPALVPTTPA